MPGTTRARRRWPAARLLPAAVGAGLLLGQAVVPGAAATLVAGRPGHVVRYGGASVTVPSSWPVVDLDRDPTACVRFDRHAVYLGTPGAEERCPAHLVGHTESVWIPAPGTAPPPPSAGGRTLEAGTGAARVLVTYGADRGLAAGIADSVRRAAAGRPTAPAVRLRATPAAAIAAEGATRATATTNVSTFIGNGFDTCAAPSESVMKAWVKASPYRAANIYIGGPLRACGQANLTAGWVSDVRAMGWRLIPTYVGLQAPCSSFAASQRMSSSTTTAAAQGRSAADDAGTLATGLGLPAGSPVYLDVENYDRSASGCSAAVLAYVRGWTDELHTLGWTSGAYGNDIALMTDLTARLGTSYPEPDAIWVANWNGLDSVLGDPAVPDTAWAGHQRIHQWHGDVSESYGGYSLSIDRNAVDGRVAGDPGGSCRSYPVGTYGPNGCTRPVAFTGPMQYWRFGAPTGRRSLMRWTHGNGSSEVNGATWRPRLTTSGTYAVDVWVPAAHADATVTYTVTDAAGTHPVKVDQSAHPGAWVPLGSYSTGDGGSITAHVGDQTATSSTVGVDAMRFTLEQALDSAPPSGQITRPAPGSFARPGDTVRLAGTFTDDVAVTKVAFFVSTAGGGWSHVGTDRHDGTGTYAVSWPESEPDGSVLSVRADAYDAAGHVTSVTADDVLTVDGTAPVAALAAPTRVLATARDRTVAWTGADDGSGVAGWDVRKQRTTAAGHRHPWHVIAAGLPAETLSTTVAVPAGSQMCFEVRGTDRAGNTSAWSAPRCAIRPVDDTALARSGHWAVRQGRSGYYEGTFTRTKHHGARLTWSRVAAHDVAVYASTCPSCGRLRVLIDGHSVGTIGLHSTGSHRHRFRSVGRFAGRTGTLTLKVISDGRRVRIDGVAVRSGRGA